MTAVLWILAVLILLGLLMASHIRLTVFYDGPTGRMDARVRYLFFYYRMKPTRERKDKEKPAGGINPEKVRKVLKDFGNIFSMVKEIFRKIGPGIVIKKLKIGITIGGDDAAEAAVRFGEANAVVFTGVSALGQLARIKKRDIRIVPDFYHPVMTARLEFSAGVRLFRIVLAGGCGVLKYLAVKKARHAHVPRPADSGKTSAG